MKKQTKIPKMGWATMGFSTILTLILCEVVLHLTTPPPLPAGFVGNCENARNYGWGFPPRFPLPAYDPDLECIVAYDSTNSRGWKDVEHDRLKPNGTVRVLFLGDSYTHGIPPLENVYHRVLEKLLVDQGYQVEVIAIGQGGWATDQAYRAFLQEGIEYSPDIVVSQFCFNDLEGNTGLDPYQDTSLKPFQYRLEGERLVCESRPRRDTRGTVLERSVRFLALHSRIYFQLLKIQGTVFTRPHDPAKDLWFLRVRPGPGGIWKPGDDDPFIEDQWRLYAAILKEWKDRCDKSGILFFAYSEAFSPSELQFCLDWGTLRRENGRILAMGPQEQWEEIDWRKPQDRWEEVCRSAGVERIPRKRDYARYKKDPHTNLQGNREMAEDIRDFFLEHPQTRTLLESNRLP
jgi:hypothetical protein